VQFYAREEVKVLVRHAASEQDAAISLSRPSLVFAAERSSLLRWRDVDFANPAVRTSASAQPSTTADPPAGTVWTWRRTGCDSNPVLDLSI
jgi:hypothetical protein